MVCILICKRCKFGEKICNNSRDIEFFLGDYFFGAPIKLRSGTVSGRPVEPGVLYNKPLVSSNVIALILSEQSIASLSTRLPSSTFDLRADRMTHMEHRFTFTARRLARFSDEPCTPPVPVTFSTALNRHSC